VALGKFDSQCEALDPGLCFACGFDAGRSSGKLDRAHIIARCEGGPDTVDNLHILCLSCHKASEGLLGDPYWAWLAERTFLDRAIQVASGAGINVGKIMAFAAAFAANPPVSDTEQP
jgi:hypothetical protein